jgi:uncharacterized protein (DUF697 family)
MAAPGSAYSFWKTIQTVSPYTIEDEASTAFKLALIGPPEHRAWLKEQLLTDLATVVEREEAENHLREYDETPDSDTARAFAFLLYPDAPEKPIGARGLNSIPLVGKLDELVEDMLLHRPDLVMALGRRFPRFRVPAANFLIRALSRVNAQIAVISALPGVLPWTAVFLPVFSVADVVLLTKNQWVLVMRLAATYGHHPSWSQVKELAGTFANAFGWRTLARQLVGLVPAGVGLILKGSIAYSGTIAIGKAAHWYYQTGKKPTKEEIQQAYKESEAEAREVAEELKSEIEEQIKQKAPAPAQSTDEPGVQA